MRLGHRIMGLMLASTAPMAAQTAATPDSMAERVALGRKLFEGKGLCFSCHGKNGEGVLAPSTRLAGRALVHIKPTVAELTTLIKEGVDSAHSTAGAIMPARGGSRLTDSEVEAVAWYVLELQKKDKPHQE